MTAQAIFQRIAQRIAESGRKDHDVSRRDILFLNEIDYLLRDPIEHLGMKASAAVS